MCASECIMKYIEKEEQCLQSLDLPRTPDQSDGKGGHFRRQSQYYGTKWGHSFERHYTDMLINSSPAQKNFKLSSEEHLMLLFK